MSAAAKVPACSDRLRVDDGIDISRLSLLFNAFGSLVLGRNVTLNERDDQPR